MPIERFEQLDVWQAAHHLVLQIYRFTQKFPNEEKFGLVSQMRRAAVSVPANIAEGFKRRGLADKSRFYNIAQASLEELRYYVVLCHDLDYRNGDEGISERAENVSKMLYGLVRSLETRSYKTL
ncbi:MAG: four helix bundle protein [Terriglobia bacterium]|jgi:four helix bundle protein